ncbi:TIGR03619 family F420-dependent LLM class oxidoreductase [Gordonia sp. LSe1-13]|uniref:TIGR03619 family F420-dependent LLM class oxidoreductase n=1 Tax=Gordonia sesuvii TaxID=3116777 RepID=A0ABU7M9X4_9ACTN|nr:TIGR03619 family F420-dependent LLM class oxidoreductase [Gordonia sp. LSe1-13]
MTQTAPMRFVLEYPSELPAAPDEFLHPKVIRDVVAQAEDSRFAGVALSDHPAPSVKWRANGGHETLDPVAALSFMAGVSSEIALLTNLYVLPFRNPYVTAKALGSLDLISGGRLIAGVGAGYLRSEFSAVGVDFERRAALLDESLEAVRSIWTDPEMPVHGNGFGAIGPVSAQRPTQRPHPPIWIGGNSRAAIRRVVEHGQGWMPLITGEAMASAIRTATISTPDQFSDELAVLRKRLADAGRDPESIDVQVVCPPTDLSDAASVRGARDFLADLGRRGATWVVIHADGSSPRAALSYIRRFGEMFIE